MLKDPRSDFQPESTNCQMRVSSALRFCGGAATTDSTVVAAPEVEEEPAPTPFTLEPDTVDRLLEMYVVENKVPAREPGCMLMLTSAVRRDGTKVEMIEGQKMKLWLVSRLKVCTRAFSN